MCAVAECQGQKHSRGLCRRHLYRWRLYGDPLGGGPDRHPKGAVECGVQDCDKPRVCKGYCTAHYCQWRRTGSPDRQVVVLEKHQLCTVGGCGRNRQAKGYCGLHYQRWQSHGDPLVCKIAPDGDGTIDRKGYRVVTSHGHPNAQRTGKIKEHRLVMSKMLGRRLLKSENVHHKNGDRLDNDPANLELWVTMQPSGQRVSDLLAFAQEIRDRYGRLAHDDRFT